MMKNNGTLSDQLKAAAEKAPDKQSFANWFGKSHVCDSTGQPLTVYHASPKGFDIEQANPLSHFGTCQAAQDIGQRLCGDKYITYPAFLSIQNPLRIPDTGGHSRDTFRFLFESLLPSVSGENILNKDEIDYVFGQDTLKDFLPLSRFIFPERHASKSKWADRMIETLSKKGFDGFVYENLMEDKSSTSFIIFDQHQVRSAIRQPDQTYAHTRSTGPENTQKTLPSAQALK